MKKLLLLILLFSFKIYSQEILTKDEVFSKDSLVYKVSNSELFTGKIQSFKRKTHLTFELEFENGELKKSIQYYNGKALKISEEIFYRKYGKIEKKIRYGYSRDYKWFEYYDDDNKKIKVARVLSNETRYILRDKRKSRNRISKISKRKNRR